MEERDKKLLQGNGEGQIISGSNSGSGGSASTFEGINYSIQGILIQEKMKGILLIFSP
jgi:hypothetical protein